MALLGSKLYYRKNGSTYSCNRYSTISEMSGSPYIVTKRGSEIGYSVIATSGADLSNVNVKRNNIIYKLLTKNVTFPIVYEFNTFGTWTLNMPIGWTTATIVLVGSGGHGGGQSATSYTTPSPCTSIKDGAGIYKLISTDNGKTANINSGGAGGYVATLWSEYVTLIDVRNGGKGGSASAGDRSGGAGGGGAGTSVASGKAGDSKLAEIRGASGGSSSYYAGTVGAPDYYSYGGGGGAGGGFLSSGSTPTTSSYSNSGGNGGGGGGGSAGSYVNGKGGGGGGGYVSGSINSSNFPFTSLIIDIMYSDTATGGGYGGAGGTGYAKITFYG